MHGEEKTSIETQKVFNQSDFNNLIGYNYTEDLSNPTKLYSDELGSFYYEFPVQFTSALNPNNLNSSQKQDGYYKTFNVLAVERDTDNFDFYAVKFYQQMADIDNNLNAADMAFSNLENFTGIVQLTNQDKKLVFSKKLSHGEVLDSTYSGETDGFDPSAKYRSLETCDIYMVTEYTDWYKVYVIDGVEYIVKTYTQVTGSHTEQVCNTSNGGLPVFNEYGG